MIGVDAKDQRAVRRIEEKKRKEQRASRPWWGQGAAGDSKKT